MKQSFSYRALMVLTLLLMAMSAASAANRLYIEAVNIEPGETKVLTFNLDNEQACYGFQADMTLPEGLSIITTLSGKADITLSARCDGSYTAVSNLLASNVVRLGAFSTSHTAISGNSGALLSLKVKAADDFVGGTLSISNILLTTENDRDIELPDYSIVFGNKHSNKFYISDFKIAVNETKTIGIVLDNETSFTAFQTDVYMPEGLTIAANSFTLTNRATGHSVSAKSFSDGRTRITCFNTGNAVFTGNKGVLLEFGVTANKNVAENCTIELKNNIFSTTQGREYVLSNTSAQVTTERAFVQSITLDYSGLDLFVGETKQLNADVQPIFASTKDIEWSSSNPEVAAVSSTGLVSAIGIGNAKIIATAVDGSGVKSECAVTVRGIPVASISLDRTTASLTVSETCSLTALVTPANASNKSIKWSSDNTEIATVDENGTVTAKAIGEAVITAISVSNPEVTALCHITVVPTPVATVTLNKTTALLKATETIQLTTIVVPETATNKSIVWTTSDATIATVSETGLVTAIKVGQATITATAASGVKGECVVTVEATPVATITLDKTTATLKAAETVQLTATVSPESATDKSIIWSTSDATIATVSETGLVTAIKVGQATITATAASGVKDECVVTVVATPVATITLDKTTETLKATETVQLTATVSPETATDKSIVWTTSDATVATVSETGLVTAIKVGKTTITATASSGIKAECVVTVETTPAESITLSQTTAQLKVAESLVLTATVLPEATTDKTVTWTSSNEAVAKVDANGLVTAVALGEVVITAKCGEISAACTVKVVPTPAESIMLNQTTAQLKVAENLALTATVLPENTTDKTVTWSSSNEAVAKVDANGNVTAVAVGEAVITARCGSVSATCTITVVPTPVESITISQSTATLKTAETVQLTATVLPESATDKSIIWSTSNASVATVSETGLVTTHKIGNATITATASSGIKAECVVIVEATPAKSIILSHSSVEMTVGESLVISATVLPETTSDKTVTWSTSKGSVVEVDANGKVTAIGLGEVLVMAKCGEVTASCIISVIITTS